MIGAILRDATCPDVLLKGFAEGALEVWGKKPTLGNPAGLSSQPG